MTKALIFDLDGVLIHSELATFRLLQRIVKKHGYLLDDKFFEKRIGKRIKPFLNEAYKDNPSEKIKLKILNEFEQEYIDNTTNYITPIFETINFIKNNKGPCKLGLASVSSRNEIFKILHFLKIINKFQIIVSSDDIKNPKPDPEIYLKAVKMLSLPPQACVSVEDSVIGVRSALSAGLNSFVFLNGINKKKDFESLPIAGFISSEIDFEKIVIS